MKYGFLVFVTVIVLLLGGCATEDVLTKQEAEQQFRIDSAVATILFEQELDDLVSYNIRKDGTVIIKFDKSVSEKAYTKTVVLLRKSSSIKSVWAEQGGKEVCPLERPV